MSHFKGSIQKQEELEFAIFCIENLAIRLGVDAEHVYEVLCKNNILNGYIVPCYDVLHTQDKEYILDDILEFMKERGAAV